MVQDLSYPINIDALRFANASYQQNQCPEPYQKSVATWLSSTPEREIDKTP